MKGTSNKYFIFILSCFFLVFTISAQKSEEIWSKAGLKTPTGKKIVRRTVPTKFEVFELDLKLLKKKLENLPGRNEKLEKSNTVLSFPNEIGKFEPYEIFEASIMEESLQQKYPTIRSFIGKGIDNPSDIIRFSLTPLGLHAMVLHKSSGAMYIDPYTSNSDSYIVYSKKNLPKADSFVCKFVDLNTATKNTSTSNLSSKPGDANDGKLRTFRLAIATTAEYSQYHISRQGISSEATDEVKKAGVLAAIIATMTRVNGIFENDIGITMELVGNNENIIFLDATTDGFTNNDGEVLIEESQTIINAAIGTANYDIGHTFSTGGGGMAQLNSPCTTFGKAKGVTGSGNPIGDSYDIDFVAHEMGHQFGAHHTFNSVAGGCGDENRNEATAVEPGSGSTIMAYAGLCSPNNVQSQSDSYFHLISIREIWANITSGNSTCGIETVTGNNAPTLETIPDYSVPLATPFALNAVATDIDGDNLTYTWEQLDIESTNYPLVSTATNGPAFRSIAPGSSSTRYFPNQNTVIAGNLSNTWEVIPTVERTMKFGVNVRDNNAGGGQTASEETTVSFIAGSGPFKVTSQSTEEIWYAGTAQTIGWDVANTNLYPINCSFVNILLSIDGGYTYPIMLASGVANDGSHEVVVPNNSTNLGRIKIESVGNVFYSMNAVDIVIQASEFIMNFDENSKKICAPNSTVYSFTYNTFLGFNEDTNFSATGIPIGATVSFNPTSAISDNTLVEMTIDGIKDEAIGNYNITVIGTSNSIVKNTVVNLGVYSLQINSPDLTFPENNDVGVLKPYILNWENDVNALTYEIQIATEENFGTLFETAIVNTNLYISQLLQFNTKYFWRVKTINECSESNFSNVFNFTTANEVCDSYAATDIPLNIPDNNSLGVQSVINITDNKIITDVNVTVNITHPWLEDLSLKLISPSGQSVILSSGAGGQGDNYTNTIFDDEATSEINIDTAAPPFTGTFKPIGDLSLLNAKESYGTWKLKVVDAGREDFGKIGNWSLEICGIRVNGNDNDKDGVVNANDLCPNTPLGSSIDTSGCSIFSLPSDNFNIEEKGESCPGKGNGQLIISANEEHPYFTIINETKYSFTNNLTVDNLASGTYTICISVEGEPYEQCYTFEIGSVTVSGKATINSKTASVEITAGTEPYHVFINGVKILETTSPLFTVDVKNGDLLVVKSSLECEGSFSKMIELFDIVIAYPNPTTGHFEIVLPEAQSEVIIELFTAHSQLISAKSYPVIAGKVQLNIENNATGIYIVKIHLENPITLKIVKQ